MQKDGENIRTEINRKETSTFWLETPRRKIQTCSNCGTEFIAVKFGLTTPEFTEHSGRHSKLEREHYISCYVDGTLVARKNKLISKLLNETDYDPDKYTIHKNHP